MIMELVGLRFGNEYFGNVQVAKFVYLKMRKYDVLANPALGTGLQSKNKSNSQSTEGIKFLGR